MPAEVIIGSFATTDGRTVEVIRTEDGGAMLYEPGYAYGWEVSPGELNAARELLDRAAAPGQPGGEPGTTGAEADRG